MCPWKMRRKPSGGPAVTSSWAARLAPSSGSGQTATLSRDSRDVPAGTRTGMGIPFKGRWTHASVTRILTNPRIAGLNTLPNSPDIIGEGNWSPIVTPKFWAAVKDILSDPDGQARGAIPWAASCSTAGAGLRSSATRAIAAGRATLAGSASRFTSAWSTRPRLRDGRGLMYIAASRIRSSQLEMSGSWTG